MAVPRTRPKRYFAANTVLVLHRDHRHKLGHRWGKRIHVWIFGELDGFKSSSDDLRDMLFRRLVHYLLLFALVP